MTALLRSQTASTPAMLALFADQATIRHALAFEAALAGAQAAEGLLSIETANEIAAVCNAAVIDPARLAEQASKAGTLAIPLVAWLRDNLTSEAAGAVHTGATSQDVADTVLMLQIVDAASLLRADATRVVEALRTLAEQHVATRALGRTLLQDALPISLGLRFAQWRLGVTEAMDRLRGEVARNARLQFGGAAGARTGLRGRGAAVSRRMAEELSLPDGVPYHAQRGGVAAIGCSVGILIGALGKMARDVALLSQNSVGEAYEPIIEGRGRSSAMAHKRNPTGCQVALSAAIRAPSLVASLLTGLPAEYERGLGGWQAEAPVLADLFLLAAGSAAAMATIAEGLELDAERIAANVAAAGVGTDIGEACDLVKSLLDTTED